MFKQNPQKKLGKPLKTCEKQVEAKTLTILAKFSTPVVYWPWAAYNPWFPKNPDSVNCLEIFTIHDVREVECRMSFNFRENPSELRKFRVFFAQFRTFLVFYYEFGLSRLRCPPTFAGESHIVTPRSCSGFVCKHRQARSTKQTRKSRRREAKRNTAQH